MTQQEGIEMGKFERNFLIGVAAYTMIAIFTFGYAASHHPKCVETSRTVCVGNDQAMAGFGAAFLWPFYWSWEAWS